MSKKNIILSCLLAVMLVCSCMLFTACATKYAVEWKIDETVTVTVEDAKKLPSKAEEDSTITFTAEGKEGYKVSSVTYTVDGGKAKSAKLSDGKYSVPVTGDLVITVTGERVIESVAVTTNPTTMTYYTGEELDPAGMVVTVNYKNGDKEPVTNYSVNYAGDEAVAFSRGDTSFTVSYQGVTSAAVTIPAVETKVVLNGRGGAISDAALAALQGNALIHNFDNTDGIVTFTFANIPAESAIALPTDVEFPEDEGGWAFKNWKSPDLGVIAKISNDDITVSADFNAIYNVNIIKVENVKLELVEGAPYLQIAVEFVGNGTVYPYLYEGNEEISLKGGEVTAVKGNKQTISVPLTQLVEAKTEDVDSFEGKWMDIRVNTNIHGMIYTTNVIVDAESTVAEVGSMIHDANNVYKLHYYIRNSQVELKVFFRPYQYSYSIDAKEVDGEPSLVIEGQLADSLSANFAKLAGGKVSIAEWNLEGTIAADGSWKIVAPLKDIEMGATVAGAISFESADGSYSVDVIADDGKLDIAACENVMTYGSLYGNPRYYYTTKTFSKHEVTYGSDWNEPFLKVEYLGTKITFDKLELVKDGDKPYAVITGTYGVDHTAETLKAAISAIGNVENGFDFQQYSTWNRLFTYDTFDDGAIPEVMTIGMNNGVLTIKIDISGLNTENGWYMHIGGDWEASEWTKGQTIEVGGMKYYLDNGSASGLSWANSRMSIWVKNSVDPKFTATAATLEKDGEEGFLVLTGTWDTEACDDTRATEEIANIGKYDFQHFNTWEYSNPAKIGTANADGTFKVYLALKDLTKTDGLYYVHFGTNGDLKVAGEGTLTIGNTTYTLKCQPISDWPDDRTTITVAIAQ